MSSRQLFSENEKSCLTELVVKYNLHKTSDLTVASQSVKKVLWRRLTEDFNSIETNTKRSEAQLKKCYDNLKTRQKISVFTKSKHRQIRSCEGPFNLNEPQLVPSTEALDTRTIGDQTDVEIKSVIDSDRNSSEDIIPEEVVETLVEEIKPGHDTPPHHDTPPLRVSPALRSPLHDPRDVRFRVIDEEFRLMQMAHEMKERREEELFKIVKKEQEWRVMAAEQTYIKAKAERDAAEELLRCHRVKRKLSEYELKMKNKNDEI